jgi:enoyl-CoA hydratase
MAELRTEIRDRVAIVTLDAPARRNALTLGLVEEIGAGIDALEADPEVGAIVVTGAAPAFCAGADLTHLGAGQRTGLKRIYEGFLRVGRSPLPTIAAVNGAAVGAGVNLALVCDVILAGESARFDTRFLDLGLHPGGGHTWMLQQRVGAQAAAAMVLFGRSLDGRQAERIGLAWSCVPDDDLLPLAVEMAGVAARAPRDLVVRLKQTLQDIAVLTDHDAAVERELEPQVWSINQPAFRDKLAALQQRISGSGGGGGSSSSSSSSAGSGSDARQ